MKLVELVSVVLKEDKHKLHFSWKQGQISLTYHVTGHVLFSTYANLSMFALCCVVRKYVTEHVIMLKEIFDKQCKRTSTY